MTEVIQMQPDDISTTPSITELVEILRERGVRIHSHQDDAENSYILFTCDGLLEAQEITEIAVQHGYLVNRLEGVWPRIEGEWDEPYWLMVFASWTYGLPDHD